VSPRTKTFTRLVREEVDSSLEKRGLSLTQIAKRLLPTQNTFGPFGSPLDSIQEGGNSHTTSHRVETPPIAHIEPETYSSGSDIIDLDYLETHIDEELD